MQLCLLSYTPTEEEIAKAKEFRVTGVCPSFPLSVLVQTTSQQCFMLFPSQLDISNSILYPCPHVLLSLSRSNFNALSAQSPISFQMMSSKGFQNSSLSTSVCHVVNTAARPLNGSTGTHSFHNFTSGKKKGDADAKRYIGRC